MSVGDTCVIFLLIPAPSILNIPNYNRKRFVNDSFDASCHCNYKMLKEYCRKKGDTKRCLGWVAGNEFITRSLVYQNMDEIPQGYHNDMASLNDTKYTSYWLSSIDNKTDLQASFQFKGKSINHLD